MNRGEDRESGQIMLLTIGVVVLALALVFAVASASSVHLERKRLYDAADQIALDAADRLDRGRYFDQLDAGVTPQVVISDADVQAAVDAVLADSPELFDGYQEVRVVDAPTPDGRTAEVVLRARVRPTLLTWATAASSGGVVVTADARARAD
ncbi:pilus assembly protein TadG-related protein [Luteimicrobium xylanilyticum]|uniref:pilus assembly protein TadG-related protein n=1 Tax=Luteimicrobium xylanilyticum TaxID=1133546 RepID=UPI001D14F725|nr:pilus assembly protein TadG-related protein [Luteimicrobium xylanilyticum]